MEFKNPATKAKYKYTGSNWGIRLQIPNVYSGSVEKLTPEGAEALIAQGRRNIVRIDADQAVNVPAEPAPIVEEQAASKKNVPKPETPKV